MSGTLELNNMFYEAFKYDDHILFVANGLLSGLENEAPAALKNFFYVNLKV